MVREADSRPMIQRWPSQKMEDIGARLGVGGDSELPLGFRVRVEMRTTGVPQ